MSTRIIFGKPDPNDTTAVADDARAIGPRLQRSLCLLLALALSGCAGTSGTGARYDPYRCDRNGDEYQRRAC